MSNRRSDKFTTGDPVRDLEAFSRRFKFIPKLISKAEETKTRIENDIINLNEELAKLPDQIKKLEGEVAIVRAQEAKQKEAALRKAAQDEQLAREAQRAALLKEQEEARLRVEHEAAEKLRILQEEEAQRIRAEQLRQKEEAAALEKQKADEEAAVALTLQLEAALAMPEGSPAEKNKKIIELKRLNKLGLITDVVFKDFFNRLIK